MSCNTVTLAGCGALTFIVFNVNHVLFTGAVGDFTITGSVDTVTNTPGTPTSATLDMSDTHIVNTSGASHTLAIDITGFNFTLPAFGATGGMTLSGSQSMSTGEVKVPVGGTVTSAAYADPANGVPSALLNTTGCSFAVALSANCNFPGATWFRGAGKFSLRDVQTFTLAGGQDLNATSNVIARAVPEPASILLLGTGLAGLARTVRRRRSKKVAQA